MQNWTLVLVVSLSLSTIVAATRPLKLPAAIFGRPVGGFLNNPFRNVLHQAAYSANIINGTLTQKVDNFDANNVETWQQRYQYNPTFYNGSGLAFLMIGGESAISYRWIADETYTYLVWAKKYGAAVFQAEHRFYGGSHPKPDMSTESYQYFTINQALADLRVFILEMNKRYFSNVEKPRWVLFGGSYPGSLSAWFRQANPDITIGAISSSCAVNTITNYWGYIDNMALIFGDVSAQCRENIAAAFKQINEKLYSIAGRAELATKLNLCPPFQEPVTSRDIQFFYSSIIGIFQSINQYTGDNRDPPRQAGLGVPRACEIMNDPEQTDLVVRVNNVQNFYNGFFYDLNSYCNPNNYTAFMEEMKNITYDPPYYERGYDNTMLSSLDQYHVMYFTMPQPVFYAVSKKNPPYAVVISIHDRAAARGWVWQTCTELGYFQTTDGGNSMFGSAIPMDFYVDQCVQMFGAKYDADFTRAGTARTRQEHGGADNYKGTNTVFPNGSYDPWRSLGYARNQSGEVYAFEIVGTAHCADMYPANDSDKQSLKDARVFLGQQLDNYIRTSAIEATTGVPVVPTTSAAFAPVTAIATWILFTDALAITVFCLMAYPHFFLYKP